MSRPEFWGIPVPEGWNLCRNIDFELPLVGMNEGLIAFQRHTFKPNFESNLQFPHPDIPVTYQITMVLQHDWSFAMGLILRQSDVLGSAFDLCI